MNSTDRLAITFYQNVIATNEVVVNAPSEYIRLVEKFTLYPLSIDYLNVGVEIGRAHV